jgi:DNA repair photolyase
LYVQNDQPNDFLKGRGAQINTHNRFLKKAYVTEHIEGLDEEMMENSATEYYEDNPKSIISEVKSIDLPFSYSINPYQGCEHGCIYCYARNAHEYWGFSAGLDFERKIIIKKNAAELLAKAFAKKNYEPKVVVMSGNTDCYQPVERKLGITRKLLEVFLDYRNPVSIITKNNVILRDVDLLRELASMDLVSVAVSVTGVSEKLRQKLEPRTTTYANRFRVIETLSKQGIPCMVMAAPMIPGLNSDELPSILKQAADHGAQAAGFQIVRLNGAIGPIFTDWIHKAFPMKAEKVLHQIEACHGGTLNDSRWGKRMSGEGQIAESLHQLFAVSVKKYFGQNRMRSLTTAHFRNYSDKQLRLF